MSIQPLHYITPEILQQRLAGARKWLNDERELPDWIDEIKARAWVDETILARAVGEITDEAMLQRLQGRDYTYMLPRHATVADSDGPSGTWHTVHKAVYDGLLTREEYTQLYDHVKVYDPRPPE